MTKALRSQAIELIAELGFVPHQAAGVVDITLNVLAKPDAHMLAAGLDELNLALAKDQHPKGDRLRRDLAHVIWNAMLDRARV